MEPTPVLILAYLLPILFLVFFIGRTGKKFIPYLIWGLVAAVLSFYFYSFLDQSVLYPEITISPIIEEFFKALPIIIPAIIGIRNQDRDILVYALAIGIGFSAIENLHFIVVSKVPLTFFGVLARSFSTSMLHACTCGIIGYGIVLIRNFDRTALPALLFGFYTIAVTVHAIFNLFADPVAGLGGSVFDLVLPVLLFLLLLLCYDIDIPFVFTHRI